MREAIILAGGFGTRLRHVVSDVPKPMAPVDGRPFLEYLLDQLVPYRYTHVVLSTGYLHEKIASHFGPQYRGIALSYAQETTPLGTGGGMLNALGHCQGDDVAVLNGDTMFKIDHDELLHFHQRHHSNLTVVLRQVDDTSRYGSVQTDASQRITRFTEKSAASGAGLINGGIYMVTRSLFSGFTPGTNFSFEKDLMEQRVDSQPFYAYPSGSYFIDIGIPDDYYRFCDDCRQRRNP